MAKKRVMLKEKVSKKAKEYIDEGYSTYEAFRNALSDLHAEVRAAKRVAKKAKRKVKTKTKYTKMVAKSRSSIMKDAAKLMKKQHLTKSEAVSKAWKKYVNKKKRNA